MMPSTSTHSPLLQQFSHAFFHTMKEPLRNLACMSGLLNDQIKESKEGHLQQYTDALYTNAEKLESIINGLATLLHLNNKELEKRSISLTDLMLSNLDKLGHHAPQPTLNVEMNTLPTASVDPSLMGQVFFELLKNAQESGLGAPVTLRIWAEETQKNLSIIIEDSGSGINPEYLDTIKKLFVSIDRPKEHLGLGLSKVQEILSRHGGDLTLLSTPGKGTKSIIVLNKN